MVKLVAFLKALVPFSVEVAVYYSCYLNITLDVPMTTSYRIKMKKLLTVITNVESF